MSSWTPEKLQDERRRLAIRFKWEKDRHFTVSGHEFFVTPGCRGSTRIYCLTCNTFELSFEKRDIEPRLRGHIAEHFRLNGD